MRSLMIYQTIAISKRFVTNFTLVWLFSRMRSLMTYHIYALSKRFFTYVTLVWLFSRMRSLMNYQTIAKSHTGMASLPCACADDVSYNCYEWMIFHTHHTCMAFLLSTYDFWCSIIFFFGFSTFFTYSYQFCRIYC